MRRVRILAACGLVATITCLWAAGASAHVTVQPPQAVKGARTVLTFRVPNEKQVAATGLQVLFPKDHPFTSARVKPVPGWTYEIKTAKLDTPVTGEGGNQITDYVSEIEWKGGRILPAEFQEFEVSAGPLPKDVNELTFPTNQIYEDETVRWIEKRQPGQPDPSRPEPRLILVDTPADAITGAATTTTAPAHEAGAETTPSASGEGATGSDNTNTLAAVALAVGIVALLLAIGGFFAMSRRGA